eukprot:scaffold53126_cov77-Phaeocystis_antarctica.AAC.1
MRTQLPPVCGIGHQPLDVVGQACGAPPLVNPLARGHDEYTIVLPIGGRLDHEVARAPLDCRFERGTVVPRPFSQRAPQKRSIQDGHHW